MTRSTTWGRLKKVATGAGVAVFWVLVWQLLSMAINQQLLLTSPLQTIKALGWMLTTRSYYISIFNSLGRIFIGFCLGVIFGFILGTLSHRFKLLRTLLRPMMLVIKAIPVASFVILALLWFGSLYLSVFTSFLMVLPVVYVNVLEGYDSTDERILEMARAFRMRAYKRMRYIYLPQLMPFLSSALSLSLGLCWKAGVAAEVIGLPDQSIGSSLYQSKIFLNTPDLFAWTLTILAVSLLFEKLVLFIMNRLVLRLEGE